MVYLNLAICYYELNECSKALNYVESAISLNYTTPFIMELKKDILKCLDED